MDQKPMMTSDTHELYELVQRAYYFFDTWSIEACPEMLRELKALHNDCMKAVNKYADEYLEGEEE